MTSGDFIQRLLRNTAARWSLAAIAALVLVAIVGPFLVKYPPMQQLDLVGLKNAPPSRAHP
ncbi:MAG TPA: hypothetical protein VIP11_01440, partial [Gemmatimonadaceae bacterium]